jgi:diguanylate cyclase (GGDEF)-like protein
MSLLHRPQERRHAADALLRSQFAADLGPLGQNWGLRSGRGDAGLIKSRYVPAVTAAPRGIEANRMWIVGALLIALLAATAAVVGWMFGRRRRGKSGARDEDLGTSSLFTETERQMLELIAKGASLSEVLDTLTAAIERISPESLCTIMLLDEEHRRRLLIASGPSLPPAYLHAANGLEIGPEVGACGTAAFRNETVIVEDIGTDPKFASARDFVLSHGLRSCWSQPIRDSKGAVLGTFAIYRREPSSPRPQELRLARVAGQLAGNAVERIRAERELRDAVKRLSLAETVARFGIWEADFHKGIIVLSEGLAALMERPRSKFQLTRAEFEAMVHPEDRGVLWAGADRGKAPAGAVQEEFRLVLPSGAVRWMRSQWGFEQGGHAQSRATGAMIDVTAEKHMLVEAEQERAAAEASARVARQAERLEQDRKMILELVANDQPLEQVAASMVEAVASHLPRSLCAIRIEVPNDSPIALYPGFPQPLAEALERIEIASINESLASAPIENLSDAAYWRRYIEQTGAPAAYRLYRAVAVNRDSHRTGIILSLLREDCADSQSQQRLLESWARFASLAVERRMLYKQLSFRAQYDALTHLLNRASLYEHLSMLTRTGGANALALVYLDLDRFKEINDTFGHSAGDRVLQHVAERISVAVRRSDAVARIGGDEFIAILSGISERRDAERLAEAIARSIETPVEVEGRLLSVGVSAGISLYPIDGSDADALLKIADEAMYRMKLSHRNAAPRRPSVVEGTAPQECGGGTTAVSR